MADCSSGAASGRPPTIFGCRPAGPFVVIAADAAGSGADALPDIEPKLRSLDIASAWRRLPDVQVGIVHANTDRHLAAVLALVSRVAIGRVGCQRPLRRSSRHRAGAASGPGDAARPAETRACRCRCSTARSWPPPR